MINTLITIKDAIQLFVEQHEQLKSVVFEADDQRANYITENNEFPLLFVAPIDVNISRAINTHTLRIYVYERVNHDRTDVWENANDTSLILRDIRVWWNDYGNDDIHIVEDPIGQFGSDRELEKLIGYFADIRFEIPSHGRCDVPINVAPTPPPPACQPATFEINGVEVATIPSGESGSIQVLQGGLEVGVLDGGAWVIPECEICEDGTVTVNRDGVFFADVPVSSGGTATVNVPSFANKLPTKSGQTESYATGDDGNDQRARETSFFVLSQNNPFGNNRRFTGTTGGYHLNSDNTFRDKDGNITTKALAFPDSVILDWAYFSGTQNAGQVVAWRFTLAEGARDWLSTLQELPTRTFNGLLGWKMPNILEYQTIRNANLASIYNYEPFAINVANVRLWTSETVTSNPTQAYIIRPDVDDYLRSTTAKTLDNSLSRVIAIRYSNYTVTGGNVIIS